MRRMKKKMRRKLKPLWCGGEVDLEASLKREIRVLEFELAGAGNWSWC
jgi:hypothetical protein